MAGEKFKDRAKELSAATGMGDLALDSIATGYVSLPLESFYYCVTNLDADEWEVGIGHIRTFPERALARDEVLSNSAGNTGKINFSGGSKEVFSTIPADVVANLSEASISAQPYGWTGTTTSDDTPDDLTLIFSPEPSSLGGFAFLAVSFTVFAETNAGAIAWDCRLVYRDGEAAALTKSVIHSSGTISADVDADVVSDDVVVTVTGDPSTYTSWAIKGVVDCSMENGV